MEYFKDLTTREMFSSMRTDDVCQAYRVGLSTKNPLLAITAQNELIRRGDTDIVSKEIQLFVDDNSDLFESDSMFAQILGSSLCQLGMYDRTLYYVGKHILSNDKNSYDELKNSNLADDEAKLMGTLRSLIEKYDYSNRDFYELADSIFEENSL